MTGKPELPGLDQLERTCEILRALLEPLSEQDALWKPAPGRFSIAEILEHLSHAEGHCFRLRIERIVSEDSPLLEEYDQDAIAAEGQYSGRDPEESFDHFEEQRESNVEYLGGLPESALDREERHPQFGKVTAGEILAEWAFHDLGHIRQISEIVRARKYYARMGPFRSEYKINP